MVHSSRMDGPVSPVETSLKMIAEGKSSPHLDRHAHSHRRLLSETEPEPEVICSGSTSTPSGSVVWRWTPPDPEEEPGEAALEVGHTEPERFPSSIPAGVHDHADAALMKSEQLLKEMANLGLLDGEVVERRDRRKARSERRRIAAEWATLRELHKQALSKSLSSSTDPRQHDNISNSYVATNVSAGRAAGAGTASATVATKTLNKIRRRLLRLEMLMSAQLSGAARPATTEARADFVEHLCELMRALESNLLGTLEECWKEQDGATSRDVSESLRSQVAAVTAFGRAQRASVDSAGMCAPAANHSRRPVVRPRSLVERRARP